MVIATFGLWIAAAPAAPSGLALEEVERRARPAPEALGAAAQLAAAERDAARSRGVLLEGATLTAAAGPRRTPEADDADVELGLDLPLAADGAARAAARQALEAARRDLVAAAAIEARLALRTAYLGAWEAAEAARLARLSADAAQGWLAAVKARVAVGAEAPFEASLIAAEAAASRAALAGAEARVRTAWTELAARADLDAEPVPLREPPAPRAGAIGEGEGGPSALQAAVRSGAALEIALAALESARSASSWSLGATAAREGEEKVALLGVGYRFPLRGEGAARASAFAAARAERQRAAEIELERLAGRLAGARARATALAGAAPLDAAEIDRALAALDARLAAGKDRPSQALPLRRQLLEAHAVALAIRAERLRALYEIEALTTESSR
jgi:hypothetical protein